METAFDKKVTPAEVRLVKEALRDLGRVNFITSIPDPENTLRLFAGGNITPNEGVTNNQIVEAIATVQNTSGAHSQNSVGSNNYTFGFWINRHEQP